MSFRLDKSIFEKANVFIDRHEIDVVEDHTHAFIEIALVYDGSGRHFMNDNETASKYRKSNAF